MDKTWADELTLFEAYDVLGQIEKAIDRGQLGTAARLLKVPADFTGNGEELASVCQIRYRALADRIMREGK